MKKLFVFITFLFIIGVIFAQTTVFSDDFSTNLSESWTTSGQIGSSSFYVNRSGADWGARRYNNQLELTNDASSSSNAAGWVLAYTSTGGFGSPYNKTLSSNPGIVTWYFNMRQSKTNPGGFGSTSYGVAFILAGTSNTTRDTGTGYAVALGGSGSTDPIRLIKYSSGLGTSTNLITSNTSGLTDFGNEYLSIKVTYDPSNNTWELFLRNDGTTGFSNPMAGTLTTQGTTTDNTYTSSTNLDYMGGYWQGSTGGDSIAFFDNITVMVAGGGTPTNPTISVDPASLTGFSYVTGSGPSSEQSFSLTGSNLTSNLTVSIDSDKHFEISSTSGGSFVHSLTYTPSDGSVSATVYVRMKAGLAPGDYNNENIVCSSEGATSQSVTCSGTVLETQPPVLHITGTLNKFTMEQGTPSVSQSYTLYGENLTEDISITPPSGYQLSQDNINWVSSLSLAPDFSGTISVRLNGTNITSYNGDIVHTSGTAEANLAVNGIVFEPTPDNLLLLDNFYYDTDLALTSTRWTAHSGAGTNPITVQSGNLTYEGYPSIAGNLISLANSGEDINRTFSAQTSNSVYASFLVNVTAAKSGDYFIHFGTSSLNTSYFDGRIYIKSTGTGTFDFGLAKRTETPISYTGNNYNIGTTYLLVLKYEIVDGTYNDIISLFINPDISGTEPTPIISISPNTDDITEIGAIAIRQGSNTPTLKLDGIRVATSWENLFEISEQPPLPVVLTSFMAAISNQNYINLTWITQTETGMMGYYIMRNNVNDLATAQIVSPLIPAINSSQPKAYLYTDYEVTESGTYYYWLQANDLDGTIYVLSFVSIEYNVTPGGTTPSIPTVTELNNVYPNPFNPQLFIPFSLANKSEVKIIIYNTRGQVVKDFALGEKNAGNYRIEWDGTDNDGKAVPNGIYCIRMIAGKDYYQTKAILMK